MSDTLKNLWYGNIAPFDRCGAHDPETNHLAALMERNRENLIKLSTPEQQEILQKYVDCADEYWIHQMELAFYRGFSLSCQLLTAAYSQNIE